MGKFWVKLYIEILDDPKMGRMPNHIWRRAIELFLLAGKNGNDGLLQPVEEMAWIFRLSEDKLLEDLHCLAEAGVVHETKPGVWEVTHFAERQDPDTSTERSRFHRKTQRLCNETLQDVQRDATELELEEELDLESEEKRGEEEKMAAAAPAKRQSGDGAVRVFSKVTGMAAIPGTEVPRVLQAMDGLSMKYPDENKLVDYLKPFWNAWSGRKTKDNRSFSRFNCAWLYDWAIGGQVPAEDNGNGHTGDVVSQAMAMAEERKYAKAVK